MTDDLRTQLGKELNLPTNDPVLDQLLRLISDLQAGGITVNEAKSQLEQNPTLAQVNSLISFEGAHVSGGLATGDMAGNNVIKIQNNYFILPNNGGGKILATQPEASSVAERSEGQQPTNQIESSEHSLSIPPKADEEPKQLDVLSSAISYYKDIKLKQKQLLPVLLLFSVLHIEDIPSQDYKLVAQSPLFGIEDIWPEHCKLAVLALRNMIQPVQEFYDLLDKALAKTTEVVRLCSTLMTPLRIIGDGLTTLISLITRFSSVSRTLSSDMIDLRREIRENLRSLQKNLNNVKNPMDI